ncbi:hypothetical protein [Porphyromonas sp. COT-108 OH1349]|uniref:hypothetical protein n=1 Tax=Porphyromonas sp. COT-108 OH1349 TaxID=1537504 RepID=UPI00126A3EAC|nr:hypothetical protein [Porphyromonas sp. COT-108 OH1349]
MEDNKFRTREEFPGEIEREICETKKFSALMPVMEYNWEDYHSSTNNAGHITILAKEIVNQLNLVNQPQTFDLLDSDGNIASLSLKYHRDYNNSHNFVYIRKDLLDKYLIETKSKYIWIIWGEREVRFKTVERQKDFFKANPFEEYQVFQKVIEYGK